MSSLTRRDSPNTCVCPSRKRPLPAAATAWTAQRSGNQRERTRPSKTLPDMPSKTTPTPFLRVNWGADGVVMPDERHCKLLIQSNLFEGTLRHASPNSPNPS